MPKHNINDFDQLYRCTLTEKAGATSPHRVELVPVPAKRLRVLTHVTVENLLHGYTKCRLGIHAGAKDHYLDEITSPLQFELCVSRSDILLGEGDIFFAELTDATCNDPIILTAIGWENKL